MAPTGGEERANAFRLDAYVEALRDSGEMEATVAWGKPVGSEFGGPDQTETET